MIHQPAQRVLIETAAGSMIRTQFDEQRLVPMSTRHVSSPYPYAYGFLIGVKADDGECLDCYVVSRRERASGDAIACHPIALVEQWEDGIMDHNVLAVPVDEADIIAELDVTVICERISQHVSKLFEKYPAIELRVGPVRSADAATALISGLLG